MKNQVIDSIETVGKTVKSDLQSFEGSDTEVPPMLVRTVDATNVPSIAKGVLGIGGPVMQGFESSNTEVPQPKTQTEIQREGMVGMARMNYYRVSAQWNHNDQTSWIMTMNPMFGPIPPDMAIQLAAWLVKIASENGATVTFDEVWEIVKDAPA